MNACTAAQLGYCLQSSALHCFPCLLATPAQAQVVLKQAAQWVESTGACLPTLALTQAPPANQMLVSFKATLGACHHNMLQC